MRFKSFELDKFQEDAANAVDEYHSVVVSAPTGSGKTLIADYIIDKDIKTRKRVIYTAPIKALSNQKYMDFCKDYGDDKIGLITGDVVINPQALILIMTAEVYRNMAIIKDPMLHDVSYCIMDEIHYINDIERGYVWEESIIFSPDNVRFLFLSATIPNAEEFADWVKSIKNHDVKVIRHEVRPIPLEIKFFDSDLGITTLEEIKERKELDDMPEYDHYVKKKIYKRTRSKPPDYSELVKELNSRELLPCIYFIFSRVKTQDYAERLARTKDFLKPHEKKEMMEVSLEEFEKISKEVLTLRSTILLKECLAKGIAFHHAGLLPDIKHIVERLFGLGLIKVLFATETFAVGINYPAKTVCIDNLRKFTGVGFSYLNSKEFFQIAGRAGRRGIDTKGLAVSMIYRTNDELKKIANITRKDTMPIKSQFRLSFNTVLNMINMHNKKEIEQILMMNFYTYQESKGNMVSSIKARYDNIVQTLTKLGYVENGKLTDIGIFASKIFSNEIEISQIFYGDFELNEYTILLVLAALVYEEKRDVEFKNIFRTKEVHKLELDIRSHPYLKKGDWYRNLDIMTGIIYPAYEQKKFIEVLKNTNMPEGDLIRFYMQVLDKLEQIGRASHDHMLVTKIRNCQSIIKGCLEGIHIF